MPALLLFAFLGLQWVPLKPPLLTVKTAHAATGFHGWVEDFWPRARAYGISKKTYSRAFRDVRLDQEILRLVVRQPEFVQPIWRYLDSRVSEARISKGREMLVKHNNLLNAIEAVYAVDRYILVAIWGLESYYGAQKGTRKTIRSLATLSYRAPRRKKFWRAQLLAALEILQRGDISHGKMVGSWAGAMGHTQFIPTTYKLYAIDFDGDRQRNIWGSVADGLGSAANYLRASKWQTGKAWGYEVKLPNGFDYALSGLKTAKPISEWQARGIARVGGREFPRPSDQASLIVPAGAGGPSFLVLGNFRVILRYNASQTYALAVGHLADRLRGFPAFLQPWPHGDLPLTLSERKKMQQILKRKGYAIDKIDGIMGAKTSEALRAYQKAQGLKADGYPSAKLLKQLLEGL